MIDLHDRRIVPKSVHPLAPFDAGICLNRQFVNALLINLWQEPIDSFCCSNFK